MTRRPAWADAHGQLTASYTYDAVTHTGTINYSYTLLDNAVDPTSTARFGFTMIDLDGDITSGGIVIAIMDDEPLAHADTDAVAMGQVTAETGNVITGVGTTSGPAGIDVQGADGAVVRRPGRGQHRGGPDQYGHDRRADSWRVRHPDAERRRLL